MGSMVRRDETRSVQAWASNAFDAYGVNAALVGTGYCYVDFELIFTCVPQSSMHLITSSDISFALAPPAPIAVAVCKYAVDCLMPFTLFKVDYFSLIQCADCMNERWKCQSFQPNYCVICDYVSSRIDPLQEPRVEDNAALNVGGVLPLLHDNDMYVFSVYCIVFSLPGSKRITDYCYGSH